MTITAIDLDSLFPLIIGLIWVIAQIAGAAAKKKAAPQRRSAPTRTSNDDTGEDLPALSEVDEFAELIRKLGGVQEFKITTPPEPEPIVDAVPSPRSQPTNVDATPPSRSIPVQDATMASHLRSEKIADVDIRPKISSFKQAMPSIRIPAMKLSFQALEKQGSGVPKVRKIIDPSDKQSLRRAVLGHIILGKPKALEGLNSGTVEL